MRQLHSTVHMILFVAVLLVVNAVYIFAYRDAVLYCETKKDTMLNFSVKYEMLSDALLNNLSSYQSTNDPYYLAAFDENLRQYYEQDFIELGYRIITDIQCTRDLKDLEVGPPFKLSTQLKFLKLNHSEQLLHEEFIQEYNQLLERFQYIRNTEDFSALHTVEFDHASTDQNVLMGMLSQEYINRINIQEDRFIRNQNTMEVTLISLALLLLFLCIFVFYLLSEENAYNSYFRQLYTTIVENINVGLSIINESGEYEYMNPKYQKLLHINKPYYKGKHPSDLLPAEMDMLTTICDTEYMDEHLAAEIQGEPRFMDCSHFVIFDQKSQKKYIDLIHDRTQTSLMQQQLKEQLQEIEVYSHAKDSFLANISHEIKTPINAIVGLTHFLQQTELTDRQKDIAAKISSSSDILLSIINDVLDFSKIKAHSLHLYPTAFHLRNVLQHVENMLSPQIASKGLDFRTSYDFPSEVCLHMDRTRLIQIFLNLIGNACKFTDSGHITLSVSAKSETEDTIVLEFCVEDTGIGIKQSDLSRLFLEFEQIENHLTKKHEGTGLGLSICKHIVETMEGSMWVSSIPGVGSKFYFQLPCPKATEQQKENATEINNSHKNTRFDGHGAHVLVVEDTDINMEIVISLLRDVNVVCHTARDGQEAIDVCQQYPANYFTVILMDIHMPRMDGYTASHIIREQLHVTSPIIALTATSLEEAAAQKNQEVMAAYILKPFKIEEFYSTLKPFFSTGESPYAKAEEALHNMGGITSIYYKHVARFRENYRESTKEIRDFLKEQNYDEAKRTAHTVKGLAGTLGMTPLHLAATQLVKDIVDRSPELETSIALYDSALHEVLQTDPPQL